MNCIAKKCHNSFHFPCSLSGKVYLLENKGVLCESCTPPKDSLKSITTEDLIKITSEKLLISRSKKHPRKPSFVPGQYNRIGSLILYDISPDKFTSYRLTLINNSRKLIKCEKKENLYLVSDVSQGLDQPIELYRSADLENLWPELKHGNSLVLKSASDFFGFNLTSIFTPLLTNPDFYNISKENKTILEQISSLKPSLYGASKLSPYTKHKCALKSTKSHINQKSVNYEETTEGKNETILVSEYRKYKKSMDREGTLEVMSSHIHGLGLFTSAE